MTNKTVKQSNNSAHGLTDDERIEAVFEKAWQENPSARCAVLSRGISDIPMLYHFARALLAAGSPVAAPEWIEKAMKLHDDAIGGAEDAASGTGIDGKQRERENTAALRAHLTKMVAAPVADMRAGAENFACYLVDKCERETVSEELVLRWLADFIKTPKYLNAVAATPVQQDGAGEANGDLLYRVAEAGYNAHRGTVVESMQGPEWARCGTTAALQWMNAAEAMLAITAPTARPVPSDADWDSLNATVGAAPNHIEDSRGMVAGEVEPVATVVKAEGCAADFFVAEGFEKLASGEYDLYTSAPPPGQADADLAKKEGQ